MRRCLPIWKVHLVLDNYGTHKALEVAAWFKRHPRAHLHFTPTGAAWLKQVERWFAKLTAQRIRRGAFKGVAELAKAIHAYVESNNENPKPFVWTANAEMSLSKVQTLCARLITQDTSVLEQKFAI